MKNLLLFFLLTATLASGLAQDIRPVEFAGGQEILPQNFADVRDHPKIAPGELLNGSYIRYVQFEQTLNASQRKRAETAGIAFLGYVFPATYLLAIPEHADLNMLAPYHPRSIVPSKPEWKVAKSLKEQPYGDWAVHGEWLDVDLQYYPQIRTADAVALCAENNIRILKTGTQNCILKARIRAADIDEISALPFIQYLELAPPPGMPEDTGGRSLHRSNVIDSDYALGLKFNGEDVSVLVRDDGQLGPHIDFKNRLMNHTTTPPAQGTHGDGVGGVLAGAGNLNPGIKGMASGATVYVVDYGNDFQDETLPLHLNEGVTITNSSYSDGCNAGYTLATQTVDQQLFEHPTLMHFFSAGNSNSSDCGYGAGSQWGNITGGHKMAKNAIATANLLQDATLDPSSSHGPAYDGRLKPDIAANGTGEYSTAPFDDYQLFGGTSGASPGVAGCFAQLTQAYKTFHGGQQPPAVLLKAAILNTANDLGNPGPDFKYGWGHINAWRAFHLLQQNRHLADTVDQGEEKLYGVPVPGGVLQARIMLVWADPPNIPEAAKALLNDLDIKVVAPDGVTTYLPMKLDPTPNVTTLDAPAQPGRDSLNNVEQVLISLPTPGMYSVKINGTDVPQGPQSFVLVWDFDTDSIKVTYPNGGEGFVPGETEHIHWDAFGNTGSFTIRYSVDGGVSYNTITTVPGSARIYDWVVPNTVSGNVLLRISRNPRSDVSDYPFSIVGVPANIQVEKVCPDTLTLAWDALNDTISYAVFQLGARYMDLAGTTDTNFFKLPIADAGASQWLAVSAAYANGQRGRRSIALNYPGGLKNCPQNFDAAVRQLLSPGGDAIVSCGASEQPVAIRIHNEGLNVMSGAAAYYQLDNNPVVSEPLPDIQPGDSLDFTFQTPISIAINGTVQLKVWTELTGDIARFNDSLAVSLPVITQAVSGNYSEDFELSNATPLGWHISNPDDGVTWALTTAQNSLIGSDGNPTRAYFLDHYDYSTTGEEDYLYMIPLDLTHDTTPGLSFDFAHTGYNETYNDGFRVEVFPGCNLDTVPVVLFDKHDPELATTPYVSSYFLPTAASQWQRNSLDLSAFSGQKIVLRFVSENGYGNNTYLDNVQTGTYAPPTPPVASFLNPLDSACRQDPVVFQAEEITPDASYAWNFGALATPNTAVGPGPHSVTYLAAGNKTARLIASNGFGSDTAFHTVFIVPVPSPNFTYTANNLTVTFNNTTSSGLTYSWDFGDGATSTEMNPVHTYGAPGTYTVQLDATNSCKTNSKTATITLTSGVRDLTQTMGIDLSPNPTSGDFAVAIESDHAAGLRFKLFDAQGKMIKESTRQIRPGANSVAFEGLHLPQGLYQLQISAGEEGQTTLSVVVAKQGN